MSTVRVQSLKELRQPQTCSRQCGPARRTDLCQRSLSGPVIGAGEDFHDENCFQFDWNQERFIPRVPPKLISWWSHTQSPRQSLRQGWGKDSPGLPCHIQTLPSPPMITFPFCHDHWTSLSLILLKIISTSDAILICILKEVESDWVTSKEQPWSSDALTRTSLELLCSSFW